MRGIIKCSGRVLQIARPSQPDDTVPQILALGENEDHEDNDKPGGGEGVNQRPYETA